MKPLTIACCFALVLFIAACNENATDSTTTKADSPAIASAPAPAPPAAVDSATAARNWQAYMTPGEQHKMLASWSGTWDGDMTMWMAADAPPTTAKGKAVYQSILNGLYSSSVHTGTMMGMPFEGRSMVGFDHHKKVFVTSWVDNMGSGIMHMEGPWDEATNTLTLKGKMFDPTTGQEGEYREVLKVVDDKHQVMEMYGPGPDGKEFKMLEIKSTKVK